MMHHRNPAFAAAIALTLGLGLSACGNFNKDTANRSLYSVHQPVVETSSFALDLAAGSGGLPMPEQRRLADWVEALDAGAGDRLAIDGLVLSDAVRADVSAIIGRRGLVLSDAAPVTTGGIAPGAVRVTLTRAKAHVPGCPEWGERRGTPGSTTSTNYGCAVNGNLAAMIADPQHLLEGAKDTGNTVVMTSNKAIEAYRGETNTGVGGLPALATSEGN